MKSRLFPLTAAALLVFGRPVLAQEKPAPADAASPSPTATPAASPAKADPTKVADSPAVAGDHAPSPVTGTTSESEAAGAVAAPSPSASPLPLPSATPEPKADADFLPEPTDASLGAPVEAAPEPPLPTSDASPGDLPNPDSLIPPGSSDADSAPPEAPKVVENKFEQDRKLQVRYQQVKLLAFKDAGVRSLQAQADAAKTDEGKRQALREYYRLLFAKMVAIDADLKSKCDTMEQAYLRRLGQYRVSPTIPLNPPPTPEPLAN